MKTKKTIIAVLAAALVTALFIGCNVLPLEELNLNNVQKQPVPDGKVRVRINLGDSQSNARTILPDTTPYKTNGVSDPSKFPYFLLFIYSVNDSGYLTGSDVENIGSTTAAVSNPLVYITYSAFVATELELDAGNYIFTVFACSKNDSTGDYLAWGETDNGAGSNLINITGNDDNVYITLKEIITPDSTWPTYVSDGKFSWNVPLDTHTTANLTFSTLADQNTPIVSKSILGVGKTGEEGSLAPGYYVMVLELGETHFQTIYIREIVHIWSGLVSRYAPSELPELRSTHHEITFNYNDVGNTDNFEKFVDHGDPIGSLSTPTKNTDPTRYLFKNWYYEAGFTTLVNSADKVLKPLDVYAKWNQVPLVTDYVFDHKSQTYGNTIVPVAVTLYDSGSPGGVTVKYDSSETLPTNAGTYAVTFDVAAATDWEPATNLSAGNLVIAKGTPADGHFQLVKDTATIGAYTGGPSSIERVDSNKSNGNISNIEYESAGDGGSSYPKDSNLPTDPGTYTVTFNIAASSDGNWNGANGLVAGTLTLVEPKFFTLSIDWGSNSGSAPVFDASSKVTYDTVSGDLVLYILVTNPEYTSYVFEWHFDIGGYSPISSGTNVLDTTLPLDPVTQGIWWQVPGDYTFTVFITDGNTPSGFAESGTITLTIDNP